MVLTLFYTLNTICQGDRGDQGELEDEEELLLLQEEAAAGVHLRSPGIYVAYQLRSGMKMRQR